MAKTIIVTGGSRGIGAGIVKLLAEENNNIVLNYNKSEENAKILVNPQTSRSIFFSSVNLFGLYFNYNSPFFDTRVDQFTGKLHRPLSLPEASFTIFYYPLLRKF